MVWTYISRRVFDKWKSILYKAKKDLRGSNLIVNSEKELNLDHSSLEFLQSPSFKKKTHQRILVSIGIAAAMFQKKEDPVTLRQRTGNDSNTLSR
ncbi:hypothetical protein TNCV_3423031 [Trichonephila clavipes]|nr:hypothetical protein TNCV_3423031 [Trichonephila clavipes]